MLGIIQNFRWSRELFLLLFTFILFVVFALTIDYRLPAMTARR